ncbi:MAG: AAA family ATPase [Deltaproteobacteria bacterium]|nr:AAA family ATPase [Deltaproteobacteria bacterium]
MDKKSTTYEYSADMQRKIVAMFLFEEKAFSNNLEIIKPKFFDNPALEDIVSIIIEFFKRYKRIPTPNEFLDELDAFLSLDKRKSNEYLEIALDVLEIGNREADNFDYVRDKARDFARYQAVKSAIRESASILEKKKDYEGIVSMVKEACSIGEEKKHKVEDISAFMNRGLRERDIFIKNFVERHALTILAGEQKVGKSVLTINLMLSLAMGMDFLGFEPPMARRVLYIQQEISEWAMKSRLEKMLENPTEGFLKNFLKITTTGDPLKITDSRHRREIFDRIKESEPDLVVFDPLSTFHNKSENDAKEMTSVLDHFFELIKEFNIGILLVHHHGKASAVEKSGDHMPRGSSVLGDRADAIINVKRLPKKYKEMYLPHNFQNYAELEFILRSDVPLDNIIIERNPNTLWYHETDLYGQIGRKLTAEEVKKIVVQEGGEIRQKKLVEILLEKVSRPVALKCIREAEEKQYLEAEELAEKGKPRLLRLRADRVIF